MELELPGTDLIHLPPLIFQSHQFPVTAGEIIDSAEELVLEWDNDLLMPEPCSCPDPADELLQKYDLLIHHWMFGTDALNWVTSCESVCRGIPALSSLAKPDLWPHPSRRSFIQLLADKKLINPKLNIFASVGLAMLYRKPPLINYFELRHLMSFDGNLYASVYQSWADMAHDWVMLPPERFVVEIQDEDFIEYLGEAE